MERRRFIQAAAVAAAAGLAGPLSFGRSETSAKSAPFKLCLNPWAIGVDANQREAVRLAGDFGYEAVVTMPQELIEYSEEEREALLDTLRERGLSWGSTNLPLEFRQDERTFEEGLAELPALSRTLKAVGANRMNTWIMPTHPELTYLQNLRQHAKRLGVCARIVGEQGIRLGLEYVGPKTLMARDRFAFVRTMAELRELIDAIGEPNVGVVLDSFHWYCAGDTVADILEWDKDQIVTVDLNDARADLSRDEQIDGTRELPLATGVIDLEAFLQALADTGYEGPVRSEPFNQELNELDDAAALRRNHDAMSRAFALIS